MMHKSHSLEGRLQTRYVGPPPPLPPRRQFSRSALVPVSGVPLGARLAMALVDARRVRIDPLESNASSILAEAITDEPSWYETKLAAKIASDLQQNPAVSI